MVVKKAGNKTGSRASMDMNLEGYNVRMRILDNKCKVQMQGPSSVSLTFYLWFVAKISTWGKKPLSPVLFLTDSSAITQELL